MVTYDITLCAELSFSQTFYSQPLDRKSSVALLISSVVVIAVDILGQTKVGYLDNVLVANPESNQNFLS